MHRTALNNRAGCPAEVAGSCCRGSSPTCTPHQTAAQRNTTHNNHVKTTHRIVCKRRPTIAPPHDVRVSVAARRRFPHPTKPQSRIHPSNADTARQGANPMSARKTITQPANALPQDPLTPHTAHDTQRTPTSSQCDKRAVWPNAPVVCRFGQRTRRAVPVEVRDRPRQPLRPVSKGPQRRPTACSHCHRSSRRTQKRAPQSMGRVHHGVRTSEMARGKRGQRR